MTEAWVIMVCLTCGAKAEWPFCEHREANGEWFTMVTVRPTPSGSKRLRGQMAARRGVLAARAVGRERDSD